MNCSLAATPTVTGTPPFETNAAGALQTIEDDLVRLDTSDKSSIGAPFLLRFGARSQSPIDADGKIDFARRNSATSCRPLAARVESGRYRRPEPATCIATSALGAQRATSSSSQLVPFTEIQHSHTTDRVTSHSRASPRAQRFGRRTVRTHPSPSHFRGRQGRLTHTPRRQPRVRQRGRHKPPQEISCHIPRATSKYLLACRVRTWPLVS